MTNLKTLHMARCNIDDEGIRNLTQLEVLKVDHNDNITNIEHMTKLKVVDLDFNKITVGSCLLLIKFGLHIKECYYRLGNYYKNDKNYEEAISYFKLAFDSGYNKGNCLFWIAECYRMTNNFDEAIKYLKYASQNNYDKDNRVLLIAECMKMKQNNISRQ